MPLGFYFTAGPVELYGRYVLCDYIVKPINDHWELHCTNLLSDFEFIKAQYVKERKAARI